MAEQKKASDSPLNSDTQKCDNNSKGMPGGANLKKLFYILVKISLPMVES